MKPCMPSVIATGRSLWKIYGFLTFMAIGLILFSGLSLWESVNLALAAISSGGFCIHQQGIPYYNSLFLELLLIPVMIAGALPFRLYYLILENRRLSLFGDEQVKLFLVLLGIAVAVLTYDLMFFEDLGFLLALEQALFMAVSAITTTGFQIANPHSWASVTLLFLAMIAFIGGCSGSTAGGVKLNRIALAIRALVWWFQPSLRERQGTAPVQDRGTYHPESNGRTGSCQEYAGHHPLGDDRLYRNARYPPVPPHVVLLHGSGLRGGIGVLDKRDIDRVCLSGYAR